VIQYKSLPHNIFGDGTNIPNKLVIRLQPNEGIELSMVSKKQSLKERMSLQSHLLDLDFREGSDLDRIPDAYERLFLDAIQGDQSLFVGREEIEESWRWCDELIAACQNQDVPALPYQAGSWGPAKAEVLIEKDFRSWHV
jgi:glucose-6-phosphate 1-dehydrogenase